MGRKEVALSLSLSLLLSRLADALVLPAHVLLEDCTCMCALVPADACCTPQATELRGLVATSWQNPEKKLSGMHTRIIKHYGSSSPELVAWVCTQPHACVAMRPPAACCLFWHTSVACCMLPHVCFGHGGSFVRSICKYVEASSGDSDNLPPASLLMSCSGIRQKLLKWLKHSAC